MKQPEITLEDLPKPGEPLTPKIHESNQKLLDEEIAERAARVRAKLTRWQLYKLNARYAELHKALRRCRWNALVSERWELYQTCQKLSYEVKDPKNKARKQASEQLKQAIQRGKALDARIKKFRPAFDEFQTIINRLKAHREVIAWEKEDKENTDAFKKEARVWQEQMKAVCRQLARLHHVWDDTNGKRHIDIPDFTRVLFKDDRVMFQIKMSKQNPFLKFFELWRSALPYNVNVPDLYSDDTLENLSAATARVVTAEHISNNWYWVISRLDSPDGIPRKVLYEKVLDLYPAADHAKTPWAAGVTNDRKVAWFNFADNPHVLIAGTTQSGKSNHVNQMIATMVTMNRPDELRLVLVDNKGGIEFTHWRGAKHLLIPMIKTTNEVPKGLKFIRAIMERRLAMFESIGAKNLESYNEKVKDRLPRIITVIDEMATLVGLGDLTNDIHTELRTISSQGRAVGIHLILCTQHPSVDVLPGWVKTNMGVRIAGRMPSHTGSMIILDSVTAATLPDVPGRLVFSMGRNEVIAQSPYISDSSVARAVALSKEYADPDNAEFEDTRKATTPTPKPRFTEEDAIEIALTRLDSKLSPTAIRKIIGEDVITDKAMKDMVNEIIERGLHRGIEHKGKMYKPHKIRKYHVLDLVGVAEGDTTDEDTGEIKLPYYATEETEIAV